MKQNMLIAILILCFCLSSFVQDCQNFKISAPESVSESEMVTLSANLDDSSEVTFPIKWTVIIGEKLIREISSSPISFEVSEPKDDYKIIVLAESSVPNCKDVLLQKISILIVPHCGLPFTIDDYSNINWADEKIRLENVSLQFKEISNSDKSKQTKLYVYLNSKKDSSSKSIKNRLQKILKHLTSLNIEQNQIIFVISEANHNNTYFQPLPASFENNICSIYDKCFSLRGEDIEKLEWMFGTKLTNKNKK